MAYEKSQFCINSVGDRYNLGVCVVVYVFILCESTKHNNYIQRGWIGSTRTYHMVRIMYTGTHFVDRHMCGHVGSVHLVALTSVAAHSTIHHIDPEKKNANPLPTASFFECLCSIHFLPQHLRFSSNNWFIKNNWWGQVINYSSQAEVIKLCVFMLEPASRTSCFEHS